MSHPHKVAILMGSDSDLEVMKEAVDVLKKFEIACDLNVLSAHRSPRLVAEYASEARKNGFKIIICGAGGAAHLAGVVAAHATLPVIGVPIDATPLKGMDALLATVQMPAGIPVATVAIGKPGARNAGILAVQILSVEDAKLAAKLEDFKKDMEKGVAEKNKKLRENPSL
jgi:phosphoribosylaminoimidazole carboxylase PurE protein